MDGQTELLPELLAELKMDSSSKSKRFLDKVK